MAEREITRKVEVEFKPERSDPYHRDYKLIVHENPAQKSIWNLTYKELINLQEELNNLLP